MTNLPTRLSERLDTYTARDALNFLGLVLLVVIVVPFVVYAVPQVVGADESYVVMSGSMEPTIGTGDVIVVTEVPVEEIDEGDIITYGGGAAEPPTTHRVIAVEGSGADRTFRTQGDNNEDPDPSPVSASEVRGRVMQLPVSVPGADHSLFIIPFIGRVILFAQTTTGIVVLVLGPFALLAASELSTFLRESDTEPEPAGDEPEPDTTDADSDSDADAGFTVSLRLLTIAVGVLASVGTFASVRAYDTQEPVMATLAAASIAGCLIVAFLVLFGAGGAGEPDRSARPADSARVRTDGAVADAPDWDASTDRVLSAALPTTLREWSTTAVDSPEDLAELATEHGTCVVRDAETGAYFVFADGVAYTTRTAADQPESTSAEATDVDAADPDATEGKTGTDREDDAHGRDQPQSQTNGESAVAVGEDEARPDDTNSSAAEQGGDSR